MFNDQLVAKMILDKRKIDGCRLRIRVKIHSLRLEMLESRNHGKVIKGPETSLTGEVDEMHNAGNHLG